MPRSPRIQHPGAWHHVFNRGASRQATFLDPHDKQTFLQHLETAIDRYDLECHGYCLLGNHFHLLVRTPEPILDVSMQYLMGRYTRSFNARHGRDGSLFRGRYRSMLIDSDRYLLAVSRYVHRNALDTGVSRVADYVWSSYRAFLGQAQCPPWLQGEFLVSLAGGRVAYEHLVESQLHSAVDVVYERKQLPVALTAQVVGV
ncbi:MAG: transposase [Acidimicrobiales bacterium]